MFVVLVDRLLTDGRWMAVVQCGVDGGRGGVGDVAWLEYVVGGGRRRPPVIWREEIGNRNRIVNLAGRNRQ